MKKNQTKYLKQILCELPYKYYTTKQIWKYYNTMCGKYIHLMIESPEQIISYVLLKQSSEKSNLCWSYKMIDGEFCIAYKKNETYFTKENIYSEKSIVV